MSDTLVTVFGGGRVAKDGQLYRECQTLGALLAQADFLVATGGYYGSMEAVLQGAAEAGLSSTRLGPSRPPVLNRRIPRSPAAA